MLFRSALPAAIRIVKREGIDVVLTTSPPGSVHLIGAGVKRATGIPWVADLRDPLTGHTHRNVEKLLVRAKEKGSAGVAEIVGRYADAVVSVSAAITEETIARGVRGEVAEIPNGCDFDDFAGLEYRRGETFRITHAGSFFGKRDPKPFLEALARVEGVSARFVGDFQIGRAHV